MIVLSRLSLAYFLVMKLHFRATNQGTLEAFRLSEFSCPTENPVVIRDDLSILEVFQFHLKLSARKDNALVMAGRRRSKEVGTQDEVVPKFACYQGRKRERSGGKKTESSWRAGLTSRSPHRLV
jgi:hypothetical protein